MCMFWYPVPENVCVLTIPSYHVNSIYRALWPRFFPAAPYFLLGLVEILCEIFLSTDWLGYRYHLNKLPLDEAYDWIIWIRLGIELIKFWPISYPPTGFELSSTLCNLIK